MDEVVRKLVIIGSGPAGLTAAIYAARGNLKPLVIAGRGAGGQLMLTTDVDDFPGFPEGIQGPDLMMKMRSQAERFGTEFINEDVVSVDFSQKPFKIQSESKEVLAEAVIIATGATAKWLEIPSEKQFIGKGVSACAVCDGLFFKDKDVMVVGGGDAAMREAQHLAKVCKSVTIVHRRDSSAGSACVAGSAQVQTKCLSLSGTATSRRVSGRSKINRSQNQRYSNRGRLPKSNQLTGSLWP
jgi:thioredoxin reductase (NADPH)